MCIRLLLCFVLFCAQSILQAADAQVPVEAGAAEFANQTAADISIAQNTQHINYKQEFLSMLLNLGLLVGALLLISWMVRRFSRARAQFANSSSGIKIVDRRALNPKAVIYVIEVGNKSIVIGETPAGLRTLAELDPAAYHESLQNAPEVKHPLVSFADILKRQLQKFNKTPS